MKLNLITSNNSLYLTDTCSECNKEIGSALALRTEELEGVKLCVPCYNLKHPVIPEGW